MEGPSGLRPRRLSVSPVLSSFTGRHSSAGVKNAGSGGGPLGCRGRLGRVSLCELRQAV